MKDFFEELIYMCKHQDSKVRVFYIMCTAALILFPIAAIAGIVAEVVYIIADNFQLMPCIIAVVSIVFEVGIVVWLKKS